MSIRVLCILSALLTAACATAPPAPEALLSIDNRTCDNALQMDSAAPLIPERSKRRYTISADVDESAPCLNLEDGGKVTYALFSLPDYAAQTTIIAGAQMEEKRIFAANIMLLDAQSAVTRTFDREDYLFQGNTYGVQIRPRNNERYLLVQTDPEIVGEAYDSVTIGVNASTMCTGLWCSNVYSGVDYQSTRVFSYAGKVSILVQDHREEE